MIHDSTLPEEFDWMKKLILDVVGGSDGSIRMFEFMHPDQITLFRPPGQNERVNKIVFNPMGNKVLYIMYFIIQLSQKVFRFILTKMFINHL